jgi:hypothetical protein
MQSALVSCKIIIPAYSSYRNLELLEKNRKNCHEEIFQMDAEVEEVVKTVGLLIECI